MEHLPGLIKDLALILITGAVTTILFRRIKQPLVLGYIIAGILVGPYIHFTPSVTDETNINTLAEIGVIFLLFSLGLEFSFRKLKRVGGAVTITAFVEIVVITLAGYLLGTWMGWSLMDSIFLGGMLASSSTTIISKAFDELKIKTEQYARVVVGVLIVEDLVVIMLMVLLSTVAVTKEIQGAEVLFSILKLMLFLVLWFIAGIFLIPTLLRRAKKMLNDETLLILSVGMCLGMVVLATKIGFSAELGAFIMGSILAETTSAEKIEHLIRPVKDLFGAVFFVSVGMMIDPAVMVEYRWPILWVTLLVLFGKFLSTSAGALMSGQPLKQSVQVGMSMAQVGEFAFIVASLGLSLGVTSNFLFPVAVGVSAITTFTTPYMIKFSPAVNSLVIRIIPASWTAALNSFTSGSQDIRAKSSWQKIINAYLRNVITNSILVIAIFTASIELLLPILEEYIPNPFFCNLALLFIALAFAAPFLWALMAKRFTNLVYRELWVDKKQYIGPMFLLEISRVIIGILIIGYLLDRLFSPSIAIIVGLSAILVVIISFSDRINKLYHRLEKRFMTNLMARDKEESDKRLSEEALPGFLKSYPQLSVWDAHIADMEVNQNAAFIGKTLKELGWREKYGINVACIKRGDRLIFAPDKNARLLAYDHAGIIGTDEQLHNFKPVFEASERFDPAELNMEDFIVQRIMVDANNKLKGFSIRDSKIRERTNGLVIGVERNGKRILNPDSETVFEWGDIVLIAGERGKIQSVNNPQKSNES
ncbi:MAG TPA: cation:proton antiporter [Bacteroidales bacterium]|nr:sodium:proton antiporter [Bacteroidales bacterium]OQB60504.1 MAG: Inner membrane protein YbaL [Bacteroidetes bacterium ADurb.Bin145]HOU03021.1 cation:proton antiporter [Bacteroidales bacterium]HQG63423.1 cation:proton antiporter [Bacteroidales bacterium]HQK69095.1 cation:proton antiporter [Bacteroidales bacterium]